MRKRPAQSWSEFLRTARPNVDWFQARPILVLDPGETTGWAVFSQGLLVEWGQEATGKNPSLMADLIRSKIGVELILFEEYRVRGNKFRTHVGSEVVTIQHIGAIHVVAAELGIPTVKQAAGLAKAFATDVKLRRWGLFQPNQRHTNDAIRHGVRYLLFNHEPEKRAHG